MFETIRKFLKGDATDFKSLVREGAVIIDVRSATEFNSGHIAGAINIPVEILSSKTNQVKKMNKAVITCCRSGIRSKTAAALLAASGIKAFNGGSWHSLQRKI